MNDSIPSNVLDILDNSPVAPQSAATWQRPMTTTEIALAQGIPPAARAASPTAAYLQSKSLDWTVAKRPLTSDGALVESFVAIKREDTGEVLGVVGSDYQPVQNINAFRAFDAVIESGQAQIQSAGAFDGKKVWMQATFNTSHEVVVGDVVRATVVLMNGHDGSGSCKANRIVERLVCKNGMTRRATQRLYMIRHTRNVNERLEQANDLVSRVIQQTEREVAQYAEMAKRQMVTADILAYLQVVVPNPVDTEAKRAKANAERIRDEIMGLIESGSGTEIRGVRGTLWGTYNAVTEWVDHHRNSEHAENRRREANWFGSGADLKDLALETALVQMYK